MDRVAASVIDPGLRAIRTPQSRLFVEGESVIDPGLLAIRNAWSQLLVRFQV